MWLLVDMKLLDVFFWYNWLRKSGKKKNTLGKVNSHLKHNPKEKKKRKKIKKGKTCPLFSQFLLEQYFFYSFLTQFLFIHWCSIRETHQNINLKIRIWRARRVPKIRRRRVLFVFLLCFSLALTCFL